MAKPFALEGVIESAAAGDRDGLLNEWRREKQQLEETVLSLRHELDDAQSRNLKLEASLRTLRQQLSPLHRALRAVFGEIELGIGEESSFPAANSPAGSSPSSADPRWQSYKSAFPGVPALCVDALSAHTELSIPQMAALIKRAYSTTKDALAKLKQAGAVSSAGGRYRLNV